MPITTNKDNSISINGFSEGIGQSVLSDFSDMMGVNIDLPGVLGASSKFTSILETAIGVTFSIASAGQDYFTLGTADLTLHKQPVILTTTGTLPTGLTAGTVYYLWDVNGDGITFRFSELLRQVGSAYIDLSGTGTGTHTFTKQTPKSVRDYTFDANLNLYLLDSDQKVWFSQSSTSYQKFYLLAGNTSSGNGNAIIYYAGYILVFGNAKIDALLAINATTDTLTWTPDFTAAISSTSVYPDKGAVPFYSQYDNAIYFNNGTSTFNSAVARVGLFEEVIDKTFSPGDATTFSMVPDAVEISNDYGLGIVTSINEAGENLVLGTRGKNIYFWDRKSILPFSVVDMPENNTTAIISKGGSIIAFNGISGKVYQISTQSYIPLFSIPEQLFDKKYTQDAGYNGLVRIEYVDVVSVFNEILFSVQVNGNVYVMSYNVDSKSLIKKYISSLGEDLTTASTPGRIYKIIPLDKTLGYTRTVLLSTKKEASPDVWAIESLEYGSTSTKYHKIYDNDTAYVATGLISVGEVYNKKTFKELQVSFLRNLTTGQGVKIYYRRDDNSAWTLMKTIDFTTYGAIKDIKETASITDVIDLQIKIIINGYNQTSSVGNSPLLKSVRLIP